MASRVQPSPYSGFTLVEMTMVITIIGLIVGGVLVGRDMIKGAEIRGAVSELSTLQTSVRAFQLKYDCLPGDCTYMRSRFGFAADPNGGNVQVLDGNGDGIIGQSNGYVIAWSGAVYGSEPGLFWWHLLQAGYLNLPYDNTWHSYGLPNERYGQSKIPNNNWWPAFMGAGPYDPAAPPTNYASVTGFSANAFLLVGAHGDGGAPCGIWSCGGTMYTENLTAQQAFQIDSKSDDGNPSSGSIRAIAAGNYLPTSPPTIANTRSCVTDTTGSKYAVNSANADACALAFKMN